MGSNVFYMDSTAYSAAVADKIYTAAKEAGFSVLGLAKATGISRSTLDRRFTLKGLSPFTALEVKTIANVLGTTATELFTVYETVEKVPA